MLLLPSRPALRAVASHQDSRPLRSGVLVMLEAASDASHQGFRL